MIRKIKRWRINEGKIEKEGPLILHFQLEGSRGIVSLVYLAKNGGILGLVNETTNSLDGISSWLDSESTIEKNEVMYSEMRNNFINLTRQLFENLALSWKDVDFVSATIDNFDKLERLGQNESLAKEILNLWTEILKGSSKIIDFGEPELVSTEIKSLLVSYGSRNLFESLDDFSSGNFPTHYIDFSSYLSGISYTATDFGDKSCLLTGFGTKVIDALARGHADVDDGTGIFDDLPEATGRIYSKEATELSTKAIDLIDVERISTGVKGFGQVPVNVSRSYEEDVKLIGCDVGRNGSKLGQLIEIGRRAASYGTSTLIEVMKDTFSRLLNKIIRRLYENGVLDTNDRLCIAGDRKLIENCSLKIKSFLEESGFESIGEELVFVENPEPFGVKKFLENHK